MANNNIGNNMDKVFRDRLDKHEVSPNGYNWSIIESKIYRDIKKGGPSPFLYTKFAALMLAAICLSVFATKYYMALRAENNTTLITSTHNDEAFWSYMQSFTQSPTIITKEVPVIKEVTKIAYRYNEDFYKMPPKYKYQSSNGESLLSYNDVKNMLAFYEGDVTADEVAESNKTKNEQILIDSETASIDRIGNNFENFNATTTIPFLINPVYGYNNDISLSLDGGDGMLEDLRALNRKGINNILKQKLIKRTGLHFGFGGAALNTWVLNNQPTESASNSIMYPITLGHQYGGSVGYDFGSKFGVELGVYSANQGQKIAQIINLKKIETELRMDYVHFPLTFKYKWEQFSNVTQNPIILNYIFGVQYSKLQGYRSNVNESLISKNSIERTQDLGFVFGLEYDVFLAKNYYVSVGAKSTYTYNIDDLKHVFNEASYDAKANNFTVGINASINYLIPNN